MYPHERVWQENLGKVLNFAGYGDGEPNLFINEHGDNELYDGALHEYSAAERQRSAKKTPEVQHPDVIEEIRGNDSRKMQKAFAQKNTDKPHYFDLEDRSVFLRICTQQLMQGYGIVNNRTPLHEVTHHPEYSMFYELANRLTEQVLSDLGMRYGRAESFQNTTQTQKLDSDTVWVSVNAAGTAVGPTDPERHKLMDFHKQSNLGESRQEKQASQQLRYLLADSIIDFSYSYGRELQKYKPRWQNIMQQFTENAANGSPEVVLMRMLRDYSARIPDFVSDNHRFWGHYEKHLAQKYHGLDPIRAEELYNELHALGENTFNLQLGHPHHLKCHMTYNARHDKPDYLLLREAANENIEKIKQQETAIA